MLLFHYHLDDNNINMHGRRLKFLQCRLQAPYALQHVAFETLDTHVKLNTDVEDAAITSLPDPD